MINKTTLADFHVHSIYSFDGVLAPEEIIELAQEKGVTWVSVTDHNNLEGVRDLWDKHRENYKKPVIDCNGINVVSGVEVTCRVTSVANKKNRSSKVHLLVLGADLSKNSPLSKLMEIKHQNDRDYDYGVLEYLLSLKPGNGINEKHIRDFIQEKRKIDPNYSTMSRSDIFEFLNKHGITVAKSFKQFLMILENAPKFDRVDIEAQDLIDIAHASGGVVVWAHPHLNLMRTHYQKELVEALIDAGVDGIEKYYNSTVPWAIEMINEVIEERKLKDKIFFTGGSDTHSLINGNTLGNYRREEITVNNQKNVINELSQLTQAREHGKLTHRDYDINQKDIKEMNEIYKELAEEAVLSKGAESKQEIMPKLTRKEIQKIQKRAKKIKDREKQKARKRMFEHFDPDNVEIKRTPEEQEAYDEYIKNMEEKYSKNSTEQDYEDIL